MKKIQLIFALLCSVWIFSQTNFTTKWKVEAGIGFETISFYAATSTAGISDQIIYQRSNGLPVYLIEDFSGATETSPKLVTLLIPKTLGQETTVNIQIPNIITFKMNVSEQTSTNTEPGVDTNVTIDKLLDVVYWGTSPWRNLKYAFAHCKLSSLNPLDTPNLSSVYYGETLHRMFYKSSIETVANINNWNVQNVYYFKEMFGWAQKFNDNISNWTINTTTPDITMDAMFRNASSFNKPIGNWNVSMVSLAQQFLQNAYKYNHPLPSFNNTQLTNMTGVIYQTYDFNHEVSNVSFKKITNVSQALSYTFNRSPYKNTLLFDQIIKDKEVDGIPLSTSFNSISVDKINFYDYRNIYNVPGSAVVNALANGVNTFQLNPQYTVGTIYPILVTATTPSNVVSNLRTSNVGVLKEKIISPSNILRGEEFIADELYLETPIVGANAASTEVTFKMDANKDVTLYSKSYFSSSKNVKPIVNTNQYNVGTKTIVYKKGTTTPQDVSNDGTIVYDFTDHHLYVSKSGMWHRADN